MSNAIVDKHLDVQSAEDPSQSMQTHESSFLVAMMADFLAEANQEMTDLREATVSLFQVSPLFSHVLTQANDPHFPSQAQ